MKEKIRKLKDNFLSEVFRIKDLGRLEEAEIKYLGRKGEINKLFLELKGLDDAEKRIAGPALNSLKQDITAFIVKKRLELEQKIEVDLSLPGICVKAGSLHPTTLAIDEISGIFSSIGFRRFRYPEVEWDYYAFEALNMPEDHPARDEWETFFVNGLSATKGRMVLTPHTSSAQVREMEKGSLPIRMMNIGRCYRRQSDISHIPMFYQFEGLAVDEGINLQHLVGIIKYFVRSFFGQDVKVRLRPFHFRFTRPSFEVDISCVFCAGKGCRYCKQGWSELGGAGLVHPRVLEFGKINSSKYSGLAFGWGVERTYLMRQKFAGGDIRLIYKNDLWI